VDYAHRARVTPNHTMTHVLNWALREVLGDGADQRGSLVTAESLRFDFSADGVSATQLQRVEELVQGVVESAAPVTTSEVPLETALGLAGARAVAGDTYPDPVRVVTVGAASIDEMLASPGDEQWRSQSVEFCGGTHIVNTAEAGAFALLEEKAIAKGVRRIVAATGDAAQDARREGESLAEAVAKLEARKAVGEAEVAELGRRLDAAVAPSTMKLECRERLGKLRKRLRKGQKGATKAAVEALRAELGQAVAAATAKGARHCVVQVEGVDAKVLQQAVQASKGSKPDVAVLVLAEGGNDGVHCVATVPESCRADGVAADAWVRAALAPLGGKGGGSPGRAQGSAGGAGGDLPAAVEAADGFWAVGSSP